MKTLIKPDAYVIWESLNGEVLRPNELRDRLAALRSSAKKLPAEVGVEELMELAHDKRWLVEEDGKLRVEIIKK